MACDLRCPNCEDNLGKDRENHIYAYCGNCGEKFYNEEGYIDDDMD
jgi:predicted amidophosphoribosyltransferase